ncbi:hypothetical protein [uncultured Tateyamaria sp.]|uniref:hypothetical protein n=1 Tax=uncultured Tateyamaria sp. TaxID=455651 RepID=UPI0026249F20|nr:hypothetical protein [uncultured Tateyamaria sp.]
MTTWVDLLMRPFRRMPRQSLAARRPGRAEMDQIRDVPLGMEAMDMDLIDRVTRQNDALERVNMVRSRDGEMVGRSSTYVAPMPEDETYAARYHRAYNKKED